MGVPLLHDRACRSMGVLLLLLLVSLFAVACASPEPVVQAPPSPRPTLIVPPTWTPEPTETPAPTRTPRPTSSGELRLAPSTPTPASNTTPLPLLIDGKIVFSAGPSPDWENLYMLSSEGSGLVQAQLTRDQGVRNRWPTLSPDGEQIVFVSDRAEETMDIYVMQADGSDVRQLTESAGAEGWPAWSPDGEQIAFTAEREDAEGQILYVMDADGSNPRALLDDSTLTPSHPTWSPDGEQIAFAATMSETMAIYIIQADGSELSQLTPEGEEFTNPLWSPDGQTLLLQPGPEQKGLSLIQADGSNLRQLPALSRLVVGAAWFPGGQKIAFSGPPDDRGRVQQLFMYDLEGRTFTQLTFFTPDSRTWYVNPGNWVSP